MEPEDISGVACGVESQQCGGRNSRCAVDYHPRICHDFIKRLGSSLTARLHGIGVPQRSSNEMGENCPGDLVWYRNLIQTQIGAGSNYSAPTEKLAFAEAQVNGLE